MKTIEETVNGSFLNRVPEIMERGGFTIGTAIEQAYQEETVLIARLSAAAHSRGSYRDDPYREAVNLMSDRTYQKINQKAKEREQSHIRPQRSNQMFTETCPQDGLSIYECAHTYCDECGSTDDVCGFCLRCAEHEGECEWKDHPEYVPSRATTILTRSE